MIRTVRAKAGSYSVPVWITGSAGFTDAGDPNAFAPSAARISVAPTGLSDRFAPIFHVGGVPSLVGSGFAMNTFMLDGTSCTLRYWWLDDTTGLWFAVGAGVTVTSATVNLNFTGIAQPGAKFFTQVIANNGVTRIAQIIR